MKRITLILMLIIGFGNVNNAQSTQSEPTPHLRLGIKLGIGTDRDGSLVVLEPNSYTYKPSFSGGLILVYPLKKNISLELDALYSYKGVGFRLVNALPDVYASKTSHNLEVP